MVRGPGRRACYEQGASEAESLHPRVIAEDAVSLGFESFEQQEEPRMSTGVSSANVPPFTRESAITKVRGAEDAWNTRDPHRTCLGYTIDSRWRNRAEFINAREEIIVFLTRKWSRELEESKAEAERACSADA